MVRVTCEEGTEEGNEKTATLRVLCARLPPVPSPPAVNIFINLLVIKHILAPVFSHSLDRASY